MFRPSSRYGSRYLHQFLPIIDFSVRVYGPVRVFCLVCPDSDYFASGMAAKYGDQLVRMSAYVSIIKTNTGFSFSSL